MLDLKQKEKQQKPAAIQSTMDTGSGSPQLDDQPSVSQPGNLENKPLDNPGIIANNLPVLPAELTASKGIMPCTVAAVSEGKKEGEASDSTKQPIEQEPTFGDHRALATDRTLSPKDAQDPLASVTNHEEKTIPSIASGGMEAMLDPLAYVEHIVSATIQSSLEAPSANQESIESKEAPADFPKDSSPDALLQAVQSYLEKRSSGDNLAREQSTEEGKKLLRAIESLKKKEKAAYRNLNNLFHFNDLGSDVLNQQLIQEILPQKKAALQAIRKARSQLLDVLGIDKQDQASLYSYGIDAYSSDEEKLLSRQAIKVEEAFVKGVVAGAADAVKNLAHNMVNPLAGIVGMVQLVLNLPSVLEQLYEYLAEFPHLSDEALAERVGNLMTQALMPVLTRNVPNLSKQALQEASLKLKEASVVACAEIIQGQKHHLISNQIVKAIEGCPLLKNALNRDDPRLLIRAFTKKDHQGYQAWHRDYDQKVVAWLKDNEFATPKEFFKYLHEEYQKPYLKNKFSVDLSEFFNQ